MRARLVALTALALVWLWIGHAQASAWLHDTDIAVDPTWHRKQEQSVTVKVSRAKSHEHSEALPGAAIEAHLQSVGDGDDKERGPWIELAKGTSDAQGFAALRFEVPLVAKGSYRLRIRSSSTFGVSERVEIVEIQDDTQLLLRTDRGVYKPGQRLYWRLTALHAGNAHPLVERKASIKITDDRGTAIWFGEVETNEFGVASGDLPLSEDIRLGRYEVHAELDGETSRSKLEIKQFKLPPFDLKIETPTPFAPRPGATIRASLRARYHFGEPVAGRARVRLNGRSILYDAKLDGEGRAEFEFKVPRKGQFRLKAEVRDGAGRKHKAELLETSEDEELELILLPADKVIRQKDTNLFTAITTNGRGQLEPATIRITGADRAEAIVVDSPGAIRIPIPVGEGWSIDLEASASTEDGRVASHHFNSRISDQKSYFRPERAVIKAGDSIPFAGNWGRPGNRVQVSLMRHGASLATREIAADDKGEFKGSIRAPRGVFGLATLRVHELGWDPIQNRRFEESRAVNVYLRPRLLTLEIKGDKRLAPGEEGRLAVLVKDDQGKAVADAALSASIVDERALALSKKSPDLVELLQNMDMESANRAGIAFHELLAPGPHDSSLATRRLAARALLESLPVASVSPAIQVTGYERLEAERRRISSAYEGVYKQLLEQHGAIVVRGGQVGRGPAYAFRKSFDRQLAQLGWSQAKRHTPWSQPTTWGEAAAMDARFDLDRLVSRIAHERLDELRRQFVAQRRKIGRRLLRKKILRASAIGKGPRYLRVDPWGTEISIEYGKRAMDVTLVSAGPDRKLGSDDDLRYEDIYEVRPRIGLGAYGSVGHGYGAGSGFGRMARAPQVRIGNALATGAVAMRKRFDETALWAMGIRSNELGLAQIEVTMPDSITGWQLELEAIDGKGGVGTTREHLETFKENFAELELPQSLVQGDRFTASVVLQNHSGSSADYSVQVEAVDGLELLSPSRRSVSLESGASTALPLRLHARSNGKAFLTVTLKRGDQVVDRMQRPLLVEPPGQERWRQQRAELELSGDELSFEIPTGVAPGSARAELVLMRGALDQAMDGMEALLREPYGCFEQTSSSNYPNLLALKLLPKSAENARHRRRARDYLSKGYQRLISYEVKGGGFSWFGEAPANQALTAYGLLQFVDMKQVYPVDEALIKRTRSWLRGKQGSDGSWTPDDHWLHDWSAVQGKLSMTAYVAWALAESGDRSSSVKRALSFLRSKKGELGKNNYLLALWANAEVLAGSPAQAIAMLKARLKDEGRSQYLPSQQETLFYSRGTGAHVQTSALAAMAFERAMEPQLAKAMRAWVNDQRQPQGGWGSTQGTVLALRANALERQGAELKGALHLSLGKRELAAVDLNAPVILPIDLGSLRPGRHTLSIRSRARDEARPLQGIVDGLVRLRWRDKERAKAEQAGLAVALHAPTRRIRLGDAVPMSVEIENPGKELIAMPTVEIPLPPGVQLDTEELERLVKRGRIARYEDMGTQLNLYLTELGAGATVRLPYLFTAETEMRVTQLAAEAYAYYQPQLRGSSSTAILEVHPHVARRTGLGRSASLSGAPGTRLNIMQ